MAGIEFRRQPQLSVGALDKSVIKKMKRGQNVEGAGRVEARGGRVNLERVERDNVTNIISWEQLRMFNNDADNIN